MSAGQRNHPVCIGIDDRRHRPMGLKPGENAQYDDIGQMTLLRRDATHVLSLDSQDENGNQVTRYVSIRHVEKQKQQRPGGAAERREWRKPGRRRAPRPPEGSSRISSTKARASTWKCGSTRPVSSFGPATLSSADYEGGKWVLIGTVDLGAASGVVPVGILGSIDTAGDKLVRRNGDEGKCRMKYLFVRSENLGCIDNASVAVDCSTLPANVAMVIWDSANGWLEYNDRQKCGYRSPIRQPISP